MMMRIKLTALILTFAVYASTAFAQGEALPELVRRIKPSAVAIETFNSRGEKRARASGFFIASDRIITNRHVIEGAYRAEIHLANGNAYPVRGVLAVDGEGDIALLQAEVPPGLATPLEVVRTTPQEGESIVVIGNPFGLEGSVSNGIVSAVREVPNLGKIIQITAPISHGNSGSPVFNMKGQVIGVVTIKVTNGQNINLALGAARLDALKTEKLVTFEELSSKPKSGQQSEVLAEWWYRNGLNSLWLGNYDSALGYFENAVDKNPARAEAWIQVGFCKVKQGKNEEAIRAYMQAIRLRPNSYEAYNKLGDAYYYASRYYDAIEAYRRAASLRPDLAEAYYNLGMTYLEVGNRPAALAQSSLLKPLDEKLYDKLMAEIQR
jgi:tetratricopeptide (TPR) repeat protein